MPRTSTSGAELEVFLPWDTAKQLNKNTRYARGRRNVFIAGPAREAQKATVEAIKLAVEASGQVWYQTKTWLAITVRKPNRFHDPINLLDYIADAVQDGTGVNDVWFSVSSLDWTISAEPGVEVRVWQEREENERICGGCFSVLPEDNFAESKGRCRTCVKAQQRQSYLRRKAKLTTGGQIGLPDSVRGSEAPR